MNSSVQFRRPGWRSLGWALAMVLLGAAIGFGLNHVSRVGINMTIALDLDPSTGSGQVPDSAPGGQP
jgi:Na+/H+-dicarboxylate symporter